MSAQLRERLTAVSLGLALLLLAVATGLQKIRNPDYWWHLRIGYWMPEVGGVPVADPFTYTVPGAPYLDAHWLFQLGLAAVHSLGGHDGVVVAKAVLAMALVGVLATVGWRRRRPFVTALGLGTMLLVASERFLARPEMPSFLLLASVLALLERSERRDDRWVYAIVPLQLVWANLHGLFALGIALCAMYLLAELVRGARGLGRAGHARRLAAVTTLAALACLVSPNFIEGAVYPLRQLGMIAPSGDHGIAAGYILELVPVWHPRVPRATLVLPALLAVCSAVALAANWRHSRSREAHLLVFLAFLFLALQASRNLAVFAIVAAPLLIRNANERLDRHPPAPTLNSAASAVALLLLLGAAFDVARGSFHPRIGNVHEPGLGIVDFYVSEGAADWIERERPPGPIAHHMWYGGYLNWRLYPDYRVMVDGRLEIYGSEKLAELRFMTPRAFRKLNARYRFGSALLSPLFHPPQLIAWMQQNPAWRLVYADVTGVLFVRTSSEGNPQWPVVDVAAPDFLPPLAPATPLVRRKARVRLLLGLGLVERATTEAQALAPR